MAWIWISDVVRAPLRRAIGLQIWWLGDLGLSRDLMSSKINMCVYVLMVIMCFSPDLWVFGQYNEISLWSSFSPDLVFFQINMCVYVFMCLWLWLGDLGFSILMDFDLVFSQINMCVYVFMVMIGLFQDWWVFPRFQFSDINMCVYVFMVVAGYLYICFSK